jgi:hypothetical protein
MGLVHKVINYNGPNITIIVQSLENYSDVIEKTMFPYSLMEADVPSLFIQWALVFKT